MTASSRGLRGGSFYQASSSTNLQASSFLQSDPTLEYIDVGFRVASTSEPDAGGDFNHDGFVDAADYVVWRDSIGSQTGYNAWRANFGASLPGAGTSTTYSSVPEPSTMLLLTILEAHVMVQRRRKSVPHVPHNCV